MELRTQAVDRLLEALAPGLAAELDRVMREAQERLEAEFQQGLAAAVREAERAAFEIAQELQERAVAEATTAARNQLTEELESQFRLTLQQTTEQLQAQSVQEKKQAEDAWDAERDRMQQQFDQWRGFANAQPQLAECTSQPEILARFLKLTAPYADSLAIYVSKADGLALWKSRGKVFPDVVSQDTIDPEFFFKSVFIRDKPVAAVCAIQPFNPEALDFLLACLERAIESFGLKRHV